MPVSCGHRRGIARVFGFDGGVHPLHATENRMYDQFHVPMVECKAEAVLLQLGRVRESPGFARNERLSGFLRFIVERHLEGRDDILKESVIGVEVFGRRPDYDPKADAIVRTEARRLRALLNEYYLGQGTVDSVVIELPKGGYVPVIRRAPAKRELTPASRAGLRRWPMVALGCLTVFLAAVGLTQFGLQNAPIPIAVLPLVNLNQDPAYDYFADGLTSELISNLSTIDKLVVRSQTSSFVFKGKPRSVSDAGSQLHVDYILEGSVLRDGKRLRILAQLIRVRDDSPLWSGRYDSEVTDVLAIQDEISRGIANSLRVKLGSGRRRYEISAEAYDFYLRARALEIQQGLSGLNQSVDSFEQAIAKDPWFAPAYAGLATADAARSGQFGFDAVDELTKMRSAAAKAIQLDPLLAEAHDALGMVQARDGLWELSEKSFRRAIELEPSRSLSYAHFALFFLTALGRIEDALYELSIAERIDPLSPRIQGNLSYVLISARRFEDAASHCQKLPADYPGKSECLGRAWLGQGRSAEGVEVLSTAVKRGAPADDPVRGYLGYAYGQAGRREEAEKLAVAVAPNPFLQALIFAGLGDKDRTLGAVERMSMLGPVRIGRDLNSPEFALIRGDPRLTAVRKKVGLPD